jgi:hypothetical protein
MWQIVVGGIKDGSVVYVTVEPQPLNYRAMSIRAVDPSRRVVFQLDDDNAVFVSPGETYTVRPAHHNPTLGNNHDLFISCTLLGSN